jgi:cytochrome c
MTPLRIVAACAVALLSSLLLARVHPFGDAGLYAARPSTAPIMEHSAPPRVRELLITKCADCHSTQTHAPIYGRFAPISWLMERDILEGRKHMNLSAWDSLYSR